MQFLDKAISYAHYVPRRTALMGQYDLVLSLLSTLDEGAEYKRTADYAIDACEYRPRLTSCFS